MFDFKRDSCGFQFLLGKEIISILPVWQMSSAITHNTQYVENFMEREKYSVLLHMFATKKLCVLYLKTTK